MESLHSLYNQKEELVFYLRKRSLFDAKDMQQVEPGKLEIPTEQQGEIQKQIISSPFQRSSIGRALEKGSLILHGMIKPIGFSENLAFCNTMRNSHPLHYDYAQFGDTGVIVSGGMLVSTLIGHTSRDLKEILHHKINRTVHIGKVTPKQSIGAISYISDVRSLNDSYEEVRLKTIGLKEMNIESDLKSTPIPVELFQEGREALPMKPKEFRSLCDNYIPSITHKLILYADRTIIRPKVSLGNGVL